MFESQKSSSIFFFFFGFNLSTSSLKSSFIIFFFLCFDCSTSSPSLCFLERLFTVPIFTFKLLVKKMSLLCFVHESSTLHVELTSPHLSFYYLLSILFFILMRCECNRNLRIILEIQTILQKNLQTVEVVSNYW